MPELASLLTFAAAAFGMVLTPGPNMVYLISRSICQGRTASLISLGGVPLDRQTKTGGYCMIRPPSTAYWLPVT